MEVAMTESNRIVVHDENDIHGSSSRVAIDRDVVNQVLGEVPWGPEQALAILAARAIQRIPCPNGKNGERVITPYNLELVWPQ